jgi:ABC transport system ATP-binding/permease protein
VLDEPTNDLDLETLELLEALLQEYSGTLFLVSHDRAFLDNVVTQVIAFEGNGALREYAGGYSDWQRQRSQAEPTARVRPTIEERRTAQSDRQRPARLSYNETRELAALPQVIAELEREQASITAVLAYPDVYRDEPARVEALRNRYSAIESELMQALERWEALESRDSK